MADYLLPDVGEGLTEAEIVAWRVKEGDTVEINDIVVEIETAKSLVELPSPYAGVVTALLVPEGETVPVGTPIISIGDPSDERRRAGSGAPAGRATSARSTSPTRPPPVAARARAWSAATRPTADRSAVRARGRPRPATEAAAATQMQVQGAFAPGGAQSQAVVESDEPAVPAHAVTESRRRRAVRPAPWRSRRCASWPRTSASTSRQVTATGRNGSITREDVHGGRRGPPRTSYEAAAPATTLV